MTRARALSTLVAAILVTLALVPGAGAAQPEPGPPAASPTRPARPDPAPDRREVWGYDGSTFIVNGYRWYPGSARTTAFLRQLGLDRLTYDPADDTNIRGDFNGREGLHWGYDQFLYKFHGRMQSRDAINRAAASALADLTRINGGTLVGTGFAGATAPYSSGEVPPGPERTDGRGVPGRSGAVADAGGGEGDCGLTNPAGCVAGALARIDWPAVLTGLLTGLYELVIKDGVERLAADLGLLLLATPDLRGEQGSMGNVQRLVDALRAGAVGSCTVAFVLTVVQFLLGQHEAPQAALGRLGAVLVALGFYRELVGWVVRGSYAVTEGIYTAGGDATTGWFAGVLAALVPATVGLWYVLALVGALVLLALVVVKVIGFAFLLLTYVAGPLLLPLAIHPRTAPWVGTWAEHLVKALLWPALWALELRLFGALAGGVTYLAPGGGADVPSLAGGALGALTALALLVLMAGTPWVLHTQFTPRVTLAGVAQAAGREVGRAADAAVAVSTGGASLTVKAAAAKEVGKLRRAAGRAQGAAGDEGR